MDTSEKYLDPRWQKKRLEIFQRDDFACRKCFNAEETLHVHHRYYIRGADPWDYPDEALVTLCQGCHEEETEETREADALLLRAFRTKMYARDRKRLAEDILRSNLPGEVNGMPFPNLFDFFVLACSDETACVFLYEFMKLREASWQKQVKAWQQGLAGKDLGGLRAEDFRRVKLE